MAETFEPELCEDGETLVFFSVRDYLPNGDADFGFSIFQGIPIPISGRENLWQVNGLSGDNSAVANVMIYSIRLPDYVSVVSRTEHIISSSDTSSLPDTRPFPPGFRGTVLFELLEYMPAGDTDFEYTVAAFENWRHLSEILFRLERGNSRSRIKFRLTTLQWPAEINVTVLDQSLLVENGDSRSIPLYEWEQLTLTSPSGYNTRGDDDFWYTTTFEGGTLNVTTGGGREFSSAMIVVYSIAFPPQSDRYETNDGPDQAASVTEDWMHMHWRCPEYIIREVGRRECSGIFENESRLLPGAEEVWILEISELSLDSPTDRDFFRVHLPDPSNPDDGGHADIRSSTPPRGPDAEPLPECGVVQRQEGEETIDISIRGMLTVQVIPTRNSLSDGPIATGGESISLYWDGLHPESLADGHPLQKTIMCPRSEIGLTELLFSFGERTDERSRWHLTGGYSVILRYEIQIDRPIPPLPSPIADNLDDFVGGIPCLSLVPPRGIGPDAQPNPDFPYCPGPDSGPVRLGLGHPLDPTRTDCVNSDCLEALTFHWPSTESKFDVIFVSSSDLSFQLFDSDQNLSAEAVPLRTKSESLNSRTEAGQIEKRLFIAQLAPGSYTLVISGPEALYTIEYLAPIRKINQ